MPEQTNVVRASYLLLANHDTFLEKPSADSSHVFCWQRFDCPFRQAFCENQDVPRSK